jgi:hypothetical protein
MWSKTLFKTKNYTLMLYGESQPFKLRNWSRSLGNSWRSNFLKHFPASEQVRKNGTNSLAVWDDRTRKEKFNDWVNRLFERRKNGGWNKYRHGWAKLYSFISYFDTANGVKISSHEQEKAFETQGQVKMSFDEIQRTAAHYRQQKAKEHRRNLEKSLDKGLHDLAQGKYRGVRNLQFSQDSLQKVLHEREAAKHG